MVQRRSPWLACSFLLGVFVSCKDGGGGGGLIDRGACDLLIECATQLAPGSRDEFIAAYGQGGTCWQQGPAQWALCRDACRMALDALNLGGMVTGDTCGTCSTDADCAEYGVGAYCDAGLCLGGGGQSDGETGDGETGDGETGDGDGDPPATFEAVSILLVIDNSGSMGEEQRSLATAADGLVAKLDSAGIPWRLGITTSDNGNPWCPAGSTTPEGGKLVLSPCTTRLSDFLFNNGDVDVQDLACLDLCTNDDFEIVPTTTVFDSTPSERPWIESDGSQTNVAGATVTEALRCVVPQGINGCGFESQLSASYLSIARAENAEEAQYGFVHDGRLLVVVYVTDETDCSYSAAGAGIFDEDGNKAFWSDPLASFPTSAVCWNAGIQCTGDPSNYASCEPAHFDANGNPTDDPNLAVMVPVDEIIAGLGDPAAVRVFGVVGVGSDGTVHHGDVSGTDPEYQNSFGIGPGCTAPPPQGTLEPVTAVPPGRILTVIDQLGPSDSQAAFSICESNFTSAFGAIGDAIVAEF